MIDMSMDESTKDDDDDKEIAQTYHLLLMMKEAVEPLKLGEVCYKLGSLTQFEKCVDIMEEYDAHVLVLEMMESLRLNSDNQLAGLCTINSMMTASQMLLTLIEKQNIVSVINDILGRYEDDPQIQSTIFQTISILAEFGESRTALLEEQIVDFILESMQRDPFTSDVSLQSTACKAIRCLLIGNDNLQIEFVEQDHHKVFINLLSSHHDNPSVLEEALLLLALLASQEEKYDFILQASQYLIVDIMNSYPDNAELQIAACVFLKNLARTVDDQQLLVVKGIYPLVVHILRTFHNEVNAQVAALEVLDKIAGAVLTSPIWLGYRMSDLCWLEESLVAMTYHQGSIPCQVLACKVLCHLLESQPNIIDSLGEDDSPSLAVDNAVLTGLRLYGDTELSVFVAAARTIYHLAVNSKILQEHLVSKDAHLNIKYGMNIFWDNSDAQGAACQAITGLCHSSFRNKSKFVEVELHIRIFASLKKFSTVRPFLDEAVNCITCLADVDVVRNQCRKEGIHEVLMQAMVDSQGDSTFQELSLEAMSVLSKAEGMVDILCEAGLLNNTVKIMEKFDHCENIQQKGIILLQTLITHQKASFDTHLSKQVASAIITSMNKFKHDTNVLAESCVTLKLLADTSEEVSRVLVECQIHSVLFMVLEQYGSHEVPLVLTDLVCEVLYILCCRWDFMNEMIIWACKNNLNRGVEVLLQLGANVNTGSGRESPLCYACQNNNEEMMVLILEQNVSDMQTALKYCLDLKFHHLAGIILAYIGYDQEVGNVTWSNLSLNDLHAGWFFPTFGEEAANAFITSTAKPSMPKRKKHRLSSSSTTGSIDCCPIITYLNLSSNSISSLDAILSERYLLSQFQNLTKLDLSKNKLTEVKKDILQALQELDNFDISGNQLISFPAETFSSCSKLQVLNVSSNKIYSLPDVPEHSCKALHELDISNNLIRKCPMWLSEYTPNLKVLVLQRTNISSLSEQSLALPCLTTLNLSHNRMSDVPGVFLEGCPCLETLDLSHNKLESLPMHPPENLTKLNVLKLGNNKLGSDVPGFVLSLPSLKRIDLSNNGISTFAAPHQWKSSSLREVNLSHNKIKELSLDKKLDLRNWLKVEELLLSHNKISKIPNELGQLTALCKLDISYNKKITTIPDQLGMLSKLWMFPLDGLKLDLDPAIRKSRTKDIIGFLNQKLKKAVPYFRMKLIVVGYGGRGKSSLLARLRKDKPGNRRVSTTTIGIDVDELKIPVMHNKRSEAFHLTTWDIAGPEDFYSTHPCFISGRALFLVVYDLNKGTEEVTTIRHWLLTIQALAPFSPLIVVGTHKDKIPEEHLSKRISTIHYKIKELCQACGFPTVEMFAEVSCLHDDADMENLRTMIQDAIERAKIKGQPIVGQKIPQSYKLLEEFFQEEAIRLKNLGLNPIMVQSEVLKKVREKEIPLSEEELVEAARFLHETGVILHYDDPSLHLEHLYFVQPEWLCKIMAQVITVREINPFINSQGVMRKSDLYHLIKSTVDQSSHFVPTYINLLEKFEVALPLSDVELLIPSKIPSAKPNIQLPPASELLRRYYNMPYTPVGLWPRLILRLLQFSTDMLRREEIDEKFERTSKYWREGIYVCWSKKVFFVVDSVKCTDREAIAIAVPASTHGYRLFGQVCDHLDDLIEEWYPGLNETDPTRKNALLQRFAPCVGCEVSESCASAHHFTFEELLKQVEVSDTIRCEHHGDQVPIKHLAPDITFADLDVSLHIDQNHLKIRFNEFLGEGSFGSVYGARYKGKMVAVKTFANRSDVHPHRMMRQEVNVLRHLQHPCLVSMEGVAFKPRMLVMELAHLGSLGSLLNSEKGHLNRKLQHKIAVQIADGLAFLHVNRIVYRDLKPDNILIFSLQPGAPQNVKISDYGISRFTTPYGLKASKGTPGYRAPEVIKGRSTYNTEVDIFSYGILLYELVTEGHKPFQDLHFLAEIEEAVVKGRRIPQITECGVSAWPDMQDLINNCTENVPQKRPTTSMVLQRLLSPGFLCLKQRYAIGSINAEAMTVRKYRKSKDLIHEVWMTGGESSATMISLINPFTLSTKALVQGTMLEEGRGSCILAAGENLIIVGTEEGKLCVIEPTKEIAGPIVLKHSVTLPDAVLCLIHQARANNEGRILAGLANGTLLVYDVHTLRTDPNGKPVKSHQLNVSLSPLSCIVQYKAKLYVGCGNHIAILNADSLHMESRLIKNIETDKREPGQVRFIAVDKSVWICRRRSEDSNFIEVWDSGKEAFKTQLDIASLLREYDPHLTRKECDIKSMMLQPNMALWVGVAGGHLALIDQNTFKLITLVYRYTEALRTIVSVKSPESNNPLGRVVVTTGKGFMERPGRTECRVDENCVHVLVWDAYLKNQVKYVQSEIDRRNRGGQAN